MIRMNAYLQNINYITLVELMMPYMDKWLSEKDNLFYTALNKIIINDGKPSKFSKFIVSAIPKKTNLTASILQHFNDLLIEYLNNMLDREHIAAKVKYFKTDSIEGSKETMLKIEIQIDEIDYLKTIDSLLPKLIQGLSEKDDKSGRIGRLLLSFKGLPVQMMKAAIQAVPAEERDRLLAVLLSEYKEELAQLLNLTAARNNIKAEISNIHIIGDSK